METIAYAPIGVIHTPFTRPEGMPIQAAAAGGARGSVKIHAAYEAGLQDLGGFSHIILIYHCHGSSRRELLVTPFLDSVPRGVFATRAPVHPNPIGLSVVRLLAVEGRQLEVADVDMLDRTPLLDIKPFVPAFDHRTGVRCGWLEGVDPQRAGVASDKRFT